MINLDWVADFIDLKGIDYFTLAESIKKAGINIEKVITNSNPLLVIGKITSCKNHPDSDHLHVCMVDIGDNELQIVCGAPNAREGIKVIVALEGCSLPGGIIRKSVIRSVSSFGMLCSLEEIGLNVKSDGIYEVREDAILGENALKYLGIEHTLYELDVHKHRNNDCYSHLGFAYEIGAIIDKKVIIPKPSYTTINDSIFNYKSLEVKSDKCLCYFGKMVRNVKIGESPDFIKNRLNSLGIRSINNIVDISNYVMLEYGCPLHFFDSDKLGENIVVRNAYDNEVITTLDGVSRDLLVSDVLITNGKDPLCIAGVMGGESTSVSNSTLNIFIESAIFDGVSVRNTASRLNLRSEASIRFGKGINYEYLSLALDRALELLEKYANGEALSDTLSYDNVTHKKKEIVFKAEDISKILGINIDSSSVKKELSKLGFEYELNDSVFTVIIPERRLDIEENVNDIAEEIGRLYGYDNLVSTLPKASTKRGVYAQDVLYQKVISSRMRTLGFNECKTYTLISPRQSELIVYENKTNIVLPNPMSIDKSVIRTSLLASLTEVYEYNKAHNIDDIFLYEVSKVYDISGSEDIKLGVLMNGNYLNNNMGSVCMNADYYLMKGVLENVLNYMGFKNRYSYDLAEDVKGMHPFRTSKIYLDKEFLGIIGRVHPDVLSEDVYVMEISIKKLIKDIKPLSYKEPSKYPSISKDLAFIVDSNVNSLVIYDIIKKTGGRILTDIRVFDVYTGNKIDSGKKSIAYSLTFNSNERTLTEEEVMIVFNNIISKVTSSGDFRLRSL